MREFRGLAAGHGSRVVLVRPAGPLPHAMADEQRVQQIGRALVDNAIRHTPRGTEVRVAVEPQDGIVRLAVADDGPGIDADTARHLFERFYRGETPVGGGQRAGPRHRPRAGRADGRLARAATRADGADPPSRSAFPAEPAARA